MASLLYFRVSGLVWPCVCVFVCSCVCVSAPHPVVCERLGRWTGKGFTTVVVETRVSESVRTTEWRAGVSPAAGQRQDSGRSNFFLIIGSGLATRADVGANFPAAVGDTGGRRLFWCSRYVSNSFRSFPSTALDFFVLRSIACPTVGVEYLLHVWIHFNRVYKGLRKNLFLHPIKVCCPISAHHLLS